MVRTESSERREAVRRSIVNLRGDDVPAANPASLRQDTISGLSKTQRVVPGTRPEDEAFSYSKTLPTLLLYDDKGLSIYDQITALSEYYPYEAELRILQSHGPEIAHRLFGLQTDGCGNTLDAAGMQRHGFVPPDPPVPNHGAPGPRTLSHYENGQDPEVGRKERWDDCGAGCRRSCGAGGDLELPDESGRALGIRACIIELGAGSMKKTSHLLSDIVRLLPQPSTHAPHNGASNGEPSAAPLESADYFALDVEPAQLVLTLGALPTSLGSPTPAPGKVRTQGLCGTYEAGLSWLRNRPRAVSAPGTRRSLLWLGSSIGNFSPTEAAEFLKTQIKPAMQVGDTILIGVDNCTDPGMVTRAYDDEAGVTRSFILNGITAAGKEVGIGEKEGWVEDNFEYVSRYNASLARHEAYLRALCDLEFTIPPADSAGEGVRVAIQKGELIAIEVSYKFSHHAAHSAFIAAGLRVVQQWTDPSPSALHTLYLLENPLVSWPMVNDEDGSKGRVPTTEEWKRLWSAWDGLTCSMIPKEMLHQKPIDLRHICLFYVGHIPTFADIQVSRYLKEPYTEPSTFSQIFERGVDPDMDDPSKCHDHSVIPEEPDEWPALEEILDFRDRFRKRLLKLYSERVESPAGPDRFLGRLLSLIYEHEGLHLETLLYMANQLPPGGLRPPPGFAQPDWLSLARSWNSTEHQSEVIALPAAEFHIGQMDVEAEDSIKPYDPEHSYGWDNESPQRLIRVEAFKIDAMPITNEQYMDYLERTQSVDDPAQVPASWTKPEGAGDGRWHVRTIYGPVPFDVARRWPCQASGVQLAAYAGSRGGRLPTAGELRLFFDRCHPVAVGAPISNVGFRNWHPVPPAPPRRDPGTGRWSGGSNGGVWEWTSTRFASHEGFSQSTVYPGYSVDFFDGTHWVMLGGSWATIPRIAARPSVVNWYQGKYPYVFAGARVAYDA